MSEKTRTGGQIVCEVMINEGVDAIFGMPGGASLPFYDALYHYPQIRHYLMRHEQGAGFAADGYARSRNQVGVATSTSGPGATNFITSMASAMMDSVPVVFITGQVAREFIGTDAFQETDATGCSIPVTKQNYLVTDPDELPHIMKEAFYLARSGRPGPVHVDIPKDVFLAETQAPTPESVRVPGYHPPAAGNTELIKRAAELIAKSKRPVIMAGHGVGISEAWDELYQLSTENRLPVITTLHGVGCFPERHELSLGMLGMHGMYYANMAVDKADLVIGIGCRFDDRVTGRVADFAPAAKIIHIDIDPAEMGKIIPTEVPIVGDAKATLAQLNRYASPPEISTWLSYLSQLKADHPSHDPPDVENFLPQHMVRKIYEHSGGDAKVIADVGQNQMWASQNYFYDRPLHFFSAGGSGPMGYAMPAALGVAVACPDDEVWCVTGDGGLQINIQEFATLAEYQIPVKVGIMNNGHLGMIRQWQNRFYEGRLLGARLANPPFDKVAEAYGITGLRASTQAEADEAIAAARAIDGPVVIDFLVDQFEDCMPMVVPGASLGETVER